MKKILAIILAGGKGKRMETLCQGKPIPLLPFAGSLRVIDFSLSNCLHSDISNVAVLVDYHRHHLSEYIQWWSSVNAPNRVFRTLEPKESYYEGTADAVFQNLDCIQRYHADTVLILAADHVYRMDYRKMLAFHERKEADVTIGAVSVPVEQAYRFGIVSTGTEGRVIDFTEKPAVSRSSLASMGIYVFNTDTLIKHLMEDSKHPDSRHDFGYSLLPKMVTQNKVFAYKFDGYWQDIGSIDAYYETNMELVREVPYLSLNGKWPIFTSEKGIVPPNPSNNENVINSLISPGCIIRGRVENSVLSSGVKVGEQAVLRNSIVMANTIIGKHTMVDNCIIDERVNIGEFSYIGFGARQIPGDNCVTVLGSGVNIPSHTGIGHSCTVVPGIGPADFSVNAVRPGTVVSPQQLHPRVVLADAKA